MQVIDIVIGVAWVVFWVYWLAASVGTKSGRTRWGQFAGFRVALLLIVLLLLRLRLLRGQHSVNHDLLLGGIGLALFAAGLALAVWARVYIGSNWGMPMTQKDDPELVTTGPYHLIRHPIYSGILLAMIGTAVAVSVYWVIAVAVLGVYFIYSATQEERYMSERFPDAYPTYRRSTKMLVPFLL
jgi:protein-S-isoprenylcysteine O-methyltransferase Ste14